MILLIAQKKKLSISLLHKLEKIVCSIELELY